MDDLKEGKTNHQGEGGGRPSVTEEEKELMVSKLEPYLKSGLSISKSLSEARVAKATFYRIMSEDEKFRDRINQSRNFIAILANNVAVRELMALSAKQQGNPALEKKPEPLTREDKDFLWKFLLNSNLTKGEYGERKDVTLFDPEAEIQKVKGLIDENFVDEVIHDEVANEQE